MGPCNDRTIGCRVNYVQPTARRPRYHADDGSRDVLALDSRPVQIADARKAPRAPSLAFEGFALFGHESALKGCKSPGMLSRVHREETERLIRELTNADRVVLASPAVRRGSHRAPGFSRLTRDEDLYNARPATFAHIDISAATAEALAGRSRPDAARRRLRRVAHFNVWKVLSPPPQDLPLALCDSRTVSREDLLEADAVMDLPGRRESAYTGLVVRYNPRHRWLYFPDMSSDEVLVFKTYDSEPGEPSQVPHAAIQDPSCPSDAPPRVSIEARAIAYWF